jgi:hypothetical protein
MSEAHAKKLTGLTGQTSAGLPATREEGSNGNTFPEV